MWQALENLLLDPESPRSECRLLMTRLPSPWSWWKDAQSSQTDSNRGMKLTSEVLQSSMQQLGTVHCVEECCNELTKPSELPVGVSLHLMRNGAYPMWESFPHGGCWLIKIKTHKWLQIAQVDRLWEQLVQFTISRSLDAPELVGVGVSVRNKVIVFSIWNLNGLDSHSHKSAIGTELREIAAHLISGDAPAASLQYKLHYHSVRDRSSFRNSRPAAENVPEPAVCDSLGNQLMNRVSDGTPFSIDSVWGGPAVCVPSFHLSGSLWSTTAGDLSQPVKLPSNLAPADQPILFRRTKSCVSTMIGSTTVPDSLAEMPIHNANAKYNSSPGVAMEVASVDVQKMCFQILNHPMRKGRAKREIRLLKQWCAELKLSTDGGRAEVMDRLRGWVKYIESKCPRQM